MLLVFVGRALQILLTLVLMKTATTLLAPDEFGRLSLITALVSFFALTFVNPAGMYINRRFHYWQQAGSLGEKLVRFWCYLIFVAVLSGLMLSVGHLTGFLRINFELGWVLVLVCGTLLALSGQQTVVPLLNMRDQRQAFIAVTLFALVLNLGLSVLFVRFEGSFAENWALGTVAANVIGAFLGQWLLARPFGNQPKSAQADQGNDASVDHWRNVVQFAWPLSLAVGLAWVQSQSYRFVVEERLGVERLGLFVAGYGLSAGILAGVESVLTTYFQPSFYRRIGSKDPTEQASAWNDYASALLPPILLTAGFIFAFGGELARLLLGPKFQDVVIFVGLGALAETARVFVGAFGLVAHAKMKTRLLLLPYLIGAIGAVILLLTVGGTYGILGTGLALAISGWAIVISLFFTMRSQLAIFLSWKRLATGCAFGIVFVALGLLLDRTLGESQTTVASIVRLGGAGLLFLAVQAFILRPFLQEPK